MFANLYKEARVATSDLLLSEEASCEIAVPACPGWTVCDTVAHVVGLCDDWLGGNLEIYASPDWTAKQVERFNGLGTDDLVAEWTVRAAKFEPLLDDLSSVDWLPYAIATVVGPVPTDGFPAGIVVDASQHYCDIAHALGQTPKLSTEALSLCLKAMLSGVKARWRRGDLPTWTLTLESGYSTRIGDADPVGSVQVTDYELFRSLGARVGMADMRSMLTGANPKDSELIASNMVLGFFSIPTGD